MSLPPTPTLLLLAATMAPAAALPQGAPAQRSVARLVVAMGTDLTMQTWAVDRPTALCASEAAVRAVEAVEHRLSTWREDSEMAAIHRARVGEVVAVSAAMRADLLFARRIAQATDGAFEPAIGALVDAYGLRAAGRWPAAAELARARAACGPDAFALGAATIVRQVAGARFDEGGFAKGLALDAARRALVAAGATGAVLDFGGQVLVVGAAGPRWIPVAHPRDRTRIVALVRLEDESISTSGNGERGRTVEGRALGHLLDPRSGLPADDCGSISVISGDAGLADAASTALFVLGPAAALGAAAERLGVQALVVEPAADGGVRLRATAGLRDRLRALDQPPTPFPATQKREP